MSATARITLALVDGGWTVTQGDKFVDHLCWDEMLGQVVHLTHPQILRERYPMLTAGEHEQREADMLQRSEESRARWAAEDKAKDDAIGAMRDALRQWQAAESTDDGAEFANAQQARDAALDAANLVGLA